MTKRTQGILFKSFKDLITGVISIKKDIKEIETKRKSKCIFGP